MKIHHILSAAALVCAALLTACSQADNMEATVAPSKTPGRTVTLTATATVGHDTRAAFLNAFGIKGIAGTCASDGKDNQSATVAKAKLDATLAIGGKYSSHHRTAAYTRSTAIPAGRLVTLSKPFDEEHVLARASAGTNYDWGPQRMRDAVLCRTSAPLPRQRLRLAKTETAARQSFCSGAPLSFCWRSDFGLMTQCLGDIFAEPQDRCRGASRPLPRSLKNAGAPQ